MILYFDNHETATFNGYSFRLDKKTGYYLSSKPIGKKRKRLHVYVWEYYNGVIPGGYHVHHIDESKDNNEIENLQLLTASEHEALHWTTMSEERLEKARENVIKNAMPKAKAWHKSEQGREWHKIHGVEAYASRSYNEYVCTYCGNTFRTKNCYNSASNTFCSNKCKSAYRRKSGVDDIERICERCGEIFTANKYTTAKYCPKHRRNNGRV